MQNLVVDEGARLSEVLNWGALRNLGKLMVKTSVLRWRSLETLALMVREGRVYGLLRVVGILWLRLMLEVVRLLACDVLGWSILHGLDGLVMHLMYTLVIRLLKPLLEDLDHQITSSLFLHQLFTQNFIH